MAAGRSALARRVYRKVEASDQGSGFVVLLDGRPARTPAGAPLQVPTQALADRLAAEWGAQDEVVDFAQMPTTRLAFTAIDRAPGARAALISELVRFAAHDLLCHRAERPSRLVRRQAEGWDPLLAWARDALGARLEVRTSLLSSPQSAESLGPFLRAAAQASDFALTGLVAAAGLFGSAVLAFALAAFRLSGREAFALSQIEESFQIEAWGEDADAAARSDALAHEALVLEAWFKALASEPSPPQAAR